LRRYRKKLILDILDVLFVATCKIFDWIEHRIEPVNPVPIKSFPIVKEYVLHNRFEFRVYNMKEIKEQMYERF
jgi:hypothetical protein